MNVFILTRRDESVGGDKTPLGVFKTKDLILSYLHEQWENVKFLEIDHPMTEVYLEDCVEPHFVIYEFQLKD